MPTVPNSAPAPVFSFSTDQLDFLERTVQSIKNGRFYSPSELWQFPDYICAKMGLNSQSPIQTRQAITDRLWDAQEVFIDTAFSNNHPRTDDLLRNFYDYLMYESSNPVWVDRMVSQGLIRALKAPFDDLFDGCTNPHKLAHILRHTGVNVQDLVGEQTWFFSYLVDSENVLALRGVAHAFPHLLALTPFNTPDNGRAIVEHMAQYALHKHQENPANSKRLAFLEELLCPTSVFNAILPPDMRADPVSLAPRADFLLNHPLPAVVRDHIWPQARAHVYSKDDILFHLRMVVRQQSQRLINGEPLTILDEHMPFLHYFRQLSVVEQLQIVVMGFGVTVCKNTTDPWNPKDRWVAHFPIGERFKSPALPTLSSFEENPHHWFLVAKTNLEQESAVLEPLLTQLGVVFTAQDLLDATEDTAERVVGQTVCCDWHKVFLREHPLAQHVLLHAAVGKEHPKSVKKM